VVFERMRDHACVLIMLSLFGRRIFP
jgi:hypothetical protein